MLGGSLGARGLYDRWSLGLQDAIVRDPDLRDRIQVLHAVGQQPGTIEESYRTVGLRYVVVPFIHDMATAYRSAD